MTVRVVITHDDCSKKQPIFVQRMHFGKLEVFITQVLPGESETFNLDTGLGLLITEAHEERDT